MALIKVSKDDEWYTPKPIVDHFGPFDYDPASNDYWAGVLGIPNYDTIDTDGLKQDWTKYKRIWINPPFTMKKEFIAKAVETWRQNKDIYIYTAACKLLGHKNIPRVCQRCICMAARQKSALRIW